MKIFVTAGVHGDEPFSLKIVDRILAKNIPGVVVKIAHPEAIARGKRYLQTDLNRSFGSDQNSIETLLARAIEQQIKNLKPEYIIDIHTSRSNVKSVAIVAKLCTKTKFIAQALGMQSIVVMPAHIVKSSLIGRFPNKAVSIEFGKNYRSNKLAMNIANRLANLDDSFVKTDHNISVFEVVSVIDKNFENLEEIQNLEFNAKLGGYPFLAGLNTYDSIGGFLAHKLEVSLEECRQKN